MSYLKESKCYLAGPIECEDKSKPDWRPGVIRELSERFGINVFDPSKDEKQAHVGELAVAIEAKDFDTISRIATGFTKKDLGTIDRSDFLIAYAPRGICSTGTPCEVHHAIQLKKPVFVVSSDSKERAPLWYFGNMKHQYIFGSWNDLYNYLDEVDKGKHKDNHRWHFVYKMV